MLRGGTSFLFELIEGPVVAGFFAVVNGFGFLFIDGFFFHRSSGPGKCRRIRLHHASATLDCLIHGRGLVGNLLFLVCLRCHIGAGGSSRRRCAHGLASGFRPAKFAIPVQGSRCPLKVFVLLGTQIVMLFMQRLRNG